LEQINNNNNNNNNNILVKEQFGYRAKLSAEAASYSFISEILNVVNNKNLIGGIFCDLTKAFDSRGLSGYRARRQVADSRRPFHMAGLSLNQIGDRGPTPQPQGVMRGLP
jgi:hypothetical protein